MSEAPAYPGGSHDPRAARGAYRPSGGACISSPWCSATIGNPWKNHGEIHGKTMGTP